MSLPTAPSSTPMPPDHVVPAAGPPRLRGPWLVLARLACVVATLLVLGPFIAGLVVRMTHLDHLSAYAVRSGSGWTPETFSAALAQLGLSVGLYQLAFLALDVVMALFFVLVAALILWRKSDERLALLVAMALITLGLVWFTNFDWLAALFPDWTWLFDVVNILSVALGLAFCFLFPDGRFVPRWTRWLLLVWVTAE